VNGFCLGGGITLLLPHDLAIASDKAQFGLPEIKRGFLPYPIIATMFKTLIPTKLAFELILTGENWDAQKSMAAGLINRVRRTPSCRTQRGSGAKRSASSTK